MVTQQEAKEMRDAIKQLEESERQQTQTQNDAKIQIARDWYNTVEKPTPTTRQEALYIFNFIKSLIEIETDRDRLRLLKNKLDEANEKYKEIKRNGN